MTRGEHILVTGGAGMIGSNLVKRLVGMNYRVSVIDNLWRGRKDYLLNDNKQPVIDMDKDFHELDLSIPGIATPILGDVDYVYHLADIVAGIGYVFNNQGSIFRQNVLINSNLVTSVRESKIKGYIYVGTACSFPEHLQSGVDARPLEEDDQYPAAPESAYGWSKLMGEYEALLMEEEVGIPVSIPILHNVYGTPCDFDEKRSQVIPSLVCKAISYPDSPFIVWGSGQQGRAFVHVDDVVDGLVAAKDRGLGKGAIQLGPDVCTSIREIAETITQISGKNIDIIFDTDKPEGDRGRCANFGKAQEVLGWSPKITLESGLQQLYIWIEDRLAKNDAA